MAIISLSNICKKYDENIIFDNYSLDIEQGEFVSIMGKSGAGKSTLLNIIGLLEKPDSGDIVINGVKNPKFQSSTGTKLLRHHISYLFQNYGLVENETVEQNLKVGTRYLKLKKEQENKKISEALEFVGLQGYEKKKVYKLSGGEQQKCAIAKVLLTKPKILLLDEPTKGLDAYYKNNLVSLILKLK
ncbi:MAG: ATP-binding cassette domain-containing protein, partial [Acutalibacteraceae bacterium]|nr:ATP-binding cassette domain-containing protein [Acutalibacteraceae bacterium]